MTHKNKCIPDCEFIRLAKDPSERPVFESGKTYSMDAGDLVCTAGCWHEPQPISYNEYLLIRVLGCCSFCEVEK